MKNSNTFLRQATLGLLAACALVACGQLVPAAAQSASTSYKPTGSDPFTKYKIVVRRKVEKKEPPPPTQIAPPDAQARIQQYKAQRQAAMSAQQAAPKPTKALLLSELQVIGIFRTPRGYAAMVEGTPIKLSYVIYPGEVFYDGQLVAIEENRLVFRRETRWTNGQREMTVETKPLRSANAVTDALATQGAPAAGGGRAVPPPGGTGSNVWEHRDKFGSIGEQCPKGGTLKQDGAVVCNQ